MLGPDQFRTYNSKLMKSSLRYTYERWLDDVSTWVYRSKPFGKSLWQRRMHSLEAMPSQINLEVTSICNARCIMCPRHLMDRKMEVMPMDIYRKVVNEARQIGTKRFVLTGYGEIFTIRSRYHDFIVYMREQIPDAKIRVVTNGALMDEEACQLMIDQRIYRVDISIDGATKETYEAIRGNLCFETVVANTRRLIEMKRHQKARYPAIRVNIVSQKRNRHELEAFYNTWKDSADFVGDHFLLSRLGMVDNEIEVGAESPCVLPFLEVNVWSNGDVVLCSDDWNGEEVMGNVRVQSVLDIWRGEKFTRYRQLHQRGEWNRIGACSRCSSFRSGPRWFQSHRDVSAVELTHGDSQENG